MQVMYTLYKYAVLKQTVTATAQDAASLHTERHSNCLLQLYPMREAYLLAISEDVIRVIAKTKLFKCSFITDQ